MSATGIATNGTANSAAAGENLKADLAEIRRALSLLCRPGEVYELRALGTSKGTISGYFDDFEKLGPPPVVRASPENAEDRGLSGGAR